MITAVLLPQLLKRLHVLPAISGSRHCRPTGVVHPIAIIPDAHCATYSPCSWLHASVPSSVSAVLKRMAIDVSFVEHAAVDKIV